METLNQYTAFDGNRLVARGALTDVITHVKKSMGKAVNAPVLIFNDETGRAMDFNFHGTEKDVRKRLEVFVQAERQTESTGPGRPKLGVVSREVSLLPRHWEWLATQSGGASATLRRLVDEAKAKSLGGNRAKQAQERAHKVMTALAGDFEGYEEALRALYRKDEKLFLAKIASWPRDVRVHTTELAGAAFTPALNPSSRA